MKNKKLNLKKTTITKLNNLHNVRGGSFGDSFAGGCENNETNVNNLCAGTNGGTSNPFPELTKAIPAKKK